MKAPVPQLIPISEILEEAMMFVIEFVRPGLDLNTQEDQLEDQTLPLKLLKKSSSLLQSAQETDILDKKTPFEYPVVCMGGTFDHMHLGHRLLLT